MKNVVYKAYLGVDNLYQFPCAKNNLEKSDIHSRDKHKLIGSPPHRRGKCISGCNPCHDSQLNTLEVKNSSIININRCMFLIETHFSLLKD